MRDLFDHLEELPAPARRVCQRFTRILNDGEYSAFDVCASFLAALKTDGYTFDIGLDGIPTNLRKINPLERTK
tara:strand:+ start:45 stop:263 length:219 start_codon:yes stop_codon:yes gene_type:complete